MSNAEHTPQSPAAKTGLFASLRAASSVAKGSGAPALRLLAPLALALTALAAIPASALAAPPAEFGSEGPGAGQINEPRGIAVDQESGDLYVIDKFGFSGVLA